MDELLHERLEELKKIDEFLRTMTIKYEMFGSFAKEIEKFRSLELSVMIERAEEAYRKF